MEKKGHQAYILYIHDQARRGHSLGARRPPMKYCRAAAKHAPRHLLVNTIPADFCAQRAFAIYYRLSLVLSLCPPREYRTSRFTAALFPRARGFGWVSGDFARALELWSPAAHTRNFSSVPHVGASRISLLHCIYNIYNCDCTGVDALRAFIFVECGHHFAFWSRKVRDT